MDGGREGAAAAGRLSVVVPAHQEAAVIGRCLDALQDQLAPGQAEIVVVANGCTDATADIARRHPLGPSVVELAVGSKSAALNAGDACVSAFPRLYLDADVVLGPGAVDALLWVLTRGDVHVAAPEPRFETRRCPWIVRSYYRTWQRLPFLSEEPVGNGVYAMSQQGRARFDVFPPLIADDLFVLRHFTVSERRAVREVFFVVHAPRHLSDLIAVRTRAYLGAIELSAWHDGRLADSGASRVRALRDIITTLSDVPAVLAYAVVSAAASMRASRRWRRGDTTTWDRDSSTR